MSFAHKCISSSAKPMVQAMELNQATVCSRCLSLSPTPRSLAALSTAFPTFSSLVDPIPPPPPRSRSSFTSPFLMWCRVQQKQFHPDVVGAALRGTQGGLAVDEALARSSIVSGLISGAASLSRDGTRLAAHVLAGISAADVGADEDAAGWLTLPEGHVTLAPDELMQAMEIREEVDDLSDPPSLLRLLDELQARYRVEQTSLLELMGPALAAVDAGHHAGAVSSATVEQRYVHLARMRYLDRALEAIAEKLP
uniref:Co-chaperone HscB C-terminal oligomerisation domain-containing protein n=1 Tax=Sexangularia sp. CB-2014 TaxID=1486929 RepID=A0A7S1YKV7_9EUKA|mmetsp:Transcript_7623/g.24408  ORF Transcript_7623/g.24408 Transcript_7623/m.24408 type:complete len:253 (+) Transcript_7623:82-840(+)